MNEAAHLFLLIQGKYYLVERIAFEGVKSNGWRLTLLDDKEGHSPYCVIRQPSGRISCECADFTFVAQREQRPCKHVLAVKQIGLLQ